MVFIIGDKSHTVRRPAGVIIQSGDGRDIEHDTTQCCHCGRHDPVIAGSGRMRGFCTHCNQTTCTSPRCHAICYPFEKKLDDFERGKLQFL